MLSELSFLSKESIELIEQGLDLPSELAREIMLREGKLSSEGAFKDFQLKMRLLDKKHSGKALTNHAMWILDYTAAEKLIPSVELWHTLSSWKEPNLLKRYTPKQ